jgi:hypothetical protein
MVCPNLDVQHGWGSLCRLQARPYLPSEFELAEFCTTDRHRRCPLYGADGGTPLHFCQLEVERAVG